MVKKAECIQRLSENPSKAEEIEFIAAVARSIPENSYLKTFFSKKLVEKLIQDIQNDFSSDFDEFIESIVNGRLVEEHRRTAEEIQILKNRIIAAEHAASNARADRDEAWDRLEKIKRLSSGW